MQEVNNPKHFYRMACTWSKVCQCNKLKLPFATTLKSRNAIPVGWFKLQLAEFHLAFTFPLFHICRWCVTMLSPLPCVACHFQTTSTLWQIGAVSVCNTGRWESRQAPHNHNHIVYEMSCRFSQFSSFLRVSGREGPNCSSFPMATSGQTLLPSS
jgi:hypothetical protein